MAGRGGTTQPVVAVQTSLSDACVYQGAVQDAPMFVVSLEYFYLGSIVGQVNLGCEEVASILAAFLLQGRKARCRYVHGLHLCANQTIFVAAALSVRG